ncbi:hypothetical protein MKX08_003124 [Trichoderma sp. CBMAI-0020]|nr:hypothetical protein MKX08_003124 [Trichoderma sp. CBMAI-0020]
MPKCVHLLARANAWCQRLELPYYPGHWLVISRSKIWDWLQQIDNSSQAQLLGSPSRRAISTLHLGLQLVRSRALSGGTAAGAPALSDGQVVLRHSARIVAMHGVLYAVICAEWRPVDAEHGALVVMMSR